ncbi:restriction endonuclease subunit S [Megamonas funiformis]|uniref:restriction endonuclease subunit S n=1 Tax=Megamonas funiformis TaxID=437897 RepID=UPI00195AEFEC|nr:restriction endonuclease subunit S [Megamonas funiformis]MBM6649745.1 restriction endonuclease subunit S [Megamonas funiformis]
MAKKKQIELTIEEKLQNALVPKEEQPYKIPNNWCWTRLEFLSNIINGDRGKNYPSKKDYVKSGVPFITAGNIEKNNTLNKEKLNYILEDKYNILRSGKIVKDDILYCLRGTLGKNAIIDFEFKGAIASSLCIVRLLNKINKKYIYLCLNSMLIEHQMIEFNNGTAQPNLSAESLKRYKIPLPPIDEQQRIVNRIESLFTKLDKAKELIENTLAQFEQNKMAILHKAFTGELTVKWRKENNIDLSSWQNYQLKDICEKITDGTHQTPKYTDDGGYIFLSSKNVKSGKIDWKNIKYIPKDLHDILYERIAPQRDDILLAKNGTTGVAAIVDRDIIFDIYVSLALLRVNKKYILPMFLLYVIGSPRIKNYFDSNLKGIGVPNLHLKYIREATISVPTIEEQQEIVNILDNLLAKYNKIKNLEQQLEKIELLKKAILAKAFRGELGTNNPDEESAENLLKEILAEK